MVWLIDLVHKTLRLARKKGLACVLVQFLLMCLVCWGREEQQQEQDTSHPM